MGGGVTAGQGVFTGLWSERKERKTKQKREAYKMTKQWGGNKEEKKDETKTQAEMRQLLGMTKNWGRKTEQNDKHKPKYEAKRQHWKWGGGGGGEAEMKQI